MFILPSKKRFCLLPLYQAFKTIIIINREKRKKENDCQGEDDGKERKGLGEPEMNEYQMQLRTVLAR